MDVHKMEYVVAISKYQTIDKAAQALFISQPTLSVFLKRLERDLGYPLFRRENNAYIPTKEGELYIETCTKIISLQKEMNHQIEALRNNSFRIGFPVLEHMLFSPLVSRFCSNHPSLKVETSFSGSAVHYQDVLSGKLDCAYVTSWSTDVKKLYPDVLCKIVSEYELKIYYLADNPLLKDLDITDNTLKEKDIPLLAKCGLYIRSVPMIRTRISNEILPSLGLSSEMIHEITMRNSMDMLTTDMALGNGYTILPNCKMSSLYTVLTLPGHPVAYRVRIMQKNSKPTQLMQELINQCDELLGSLPYEHIYSSDTDQ